MSTGPMTKDVVAAAAATWVEAAKKLLAARTGLDEKDLHYRAYLRSVIRGDESHSTHMSKNFAGAKEAMRDLIDEWGTNGKTAGGQMKLEDQYTMLPKAVQAKFEEGKSVDVPKYLEEHGNPEAAKEWVEQNEANRDNFKKAAETVALSPEGYKAVSKALEGWEGEPDWNHVITHANSRKEMDAKHVKTVVADMTKYLQSWSTYAKSNGWDASAKKNLIHAKSILEAKLSGKTAGAERKAGLSYGLTNSWFAFVGNAPFNVDTIEAIQNIYSIPWKDDHGTLVTEEMALQVGQRFYSGPLTYTQEKQGLIREVVVEVLHPEGMSKALLTKALQQLGKQFKFKVEPLTGPRKGQTRKKASQSLRASDVQYRKINDAANLTGNVLYRPGQCKIWYWKQQFGRDFLMGTNSNAPMPTPATIEATHVMLGRISARTAKEAFYLMQGENWSPEGEANTLIRASGTGHTSMSVGDIVELNGVLWMVDRMGFKALLDEDPQQGRVACGDDMPDWGETLDEGATMADWEEGHVVPDVHHDDEWGSELPGDEMGRSAKVLSRNDSLARLQELEKKHGGETPEYFDAAIKEVKDGVIAPAAVVGGGYKDGKKQALNWLTRRKEDKGKAKDKTASDLDGVMAELDHMAEGCPDNLDAEGCAKWEANTDKYQDVVKDQHKASRQTIARFISTDKLPEEFWNWKLEDAAKASGLSFPLRATKIDDLVFWVNMAVDGWERKQKQTKKARARLTWGHTASEEPAKDDESKEEPAKEEPKDEPAKEGKTAAGNGAVNKAFLGKVDSKTKVAILGSIAKHYGISVKDAEEEVTDPQAEHLLEYLTGPERAATSLLMKRHASEYRLGLDHGAPEGDVTAVTLKAAAPSTVQGWLEWED